MGLIFGPLAIHGVLARFPKMKLGEKVWLLPDGEPVVVRELQKDSVLVAVVEDVQIRRLILDPQIVDAQFFGVLNINRGLHLSGVAQSRQ
jgi:hypothetical protein